MKKYLKKVIVTLMIATIGTSIVGCAGSKQSPTEFMNTTLEQVKEGKYEEINNDIENIQNQDESKTEDNNEIFTKIYGNLKNIEYTVNSESVDGDNATVNVTVKGPDIKKLYDQVLSQMKNNNSSETEIDETFNTFESLLVKSAENMEFTEVTMDVKLAYKDNKWTFEDNNELYKLLFNMEMN